jgi:hypothetical protein
VRWFVIRAVAASCGRIDFHSAPAIDAAPDAADAAPPDALDASAIVPCAATYPYVYGQSKYRFIQTTDTWDNAERACVADGGGMPRVVMDDSPERGAIETLVGSATVWVGLSDRVTDRAFVNVTGGSPLFLPWQNNDPSLPGPGCVEFNSAARTYHDVPCATALAAVCECDEMLAQPASY